MSYTLISWKAAVKQSVNTSQRMVKLQVKKPVGKLVESMGVAIPALPVSIVNLITSDEIGRAWIIGKIESLQDSTIRKMVVNGKVELFDDDLSIGNLLTAMKAENEAVRFSKESIEVWFKEYLVMPLDAAIRAKFDGISNDKVSKMLQDYLEAFQQLAQRANGDGKYEMKDTIKNSLLVVLALLPDDHDTVTGEEVATRLSKTVEPSAMGLALGF